VNVSLQVNVVGDQQIVDNRRENLVDLAGRRQQANLLQAVYGVFFGLLFPHALGDNRRGIGSRGTLIIH